MSKEYLFTSPRLGFRNWHGADILPMAAINADTSVMEFFPAVKSYKETEGFIVRMQQQMAEKDYCYFAVDKLENNEFIGFIGLCEQTFEADFTPCTDIGWRLCKKEWNKGYATEGAKKCVDHGLCELGLNKIVAIAPVINIPSINVMQKAGMKKVKEFIHPLLAGDERLKDCVLYETTAK